MNDVSRREAVKRAAGLAIGAGVLGTGSVLGQETKKDRPDLDAVLRVEADSKRGVELRFDLPGKADQSFSSEEYRYAVLDRDGTQVNGALMHLPLAIHTTHLPKDKRSVSDYSDYYFDSRVLKPGEEYYLVVSVRNLTALAKFKAD